MVILGRGAVSYERGIPEERCGPPVPLPYIGFRKLRACDQARHLLAAKTKEHGQAVNVLRANLQT